MEVGAHARTSRQQRPACAAHGGRKYPVSRHHVSVLCAVTGTVRVGGVRGGPPRVRPGAVCGTCGRVVAPRAAAVSGYSKILDARSGAIYHTAYRDVNLNCIIR
jgi:hypothetical protein